MATPDVSIRISAELREFKSALNQIRGDMAGLANQARVSSGTANKGIAQIAGTTRAAASAVKGLIAGFAAFQGIQLFAGLIKQGIEFNKTLETAELGIASLIAAQGELVDAQGKSVKGQEALTVAIGLSKDQMQKLRIAGLETAATTTQLVEAFQQAVGPGLTAGLNLDEIRGITIQIVQAAGALGVPMNQIAQEVRTIIDGTIDINARVAKSLGITNEQVKTWKAQGTLVEELNTRLEAFTLAGKAAADTFEVIASNTAEAFESISGQVTKGFFDSIKTALKDATSGIFDTATLGISATFSDIADLIEYVITLIGDGLAGAISGVVALAADFSEYIKENREDVYELVDSVKFLVEQFGLLLGSVIGIGGEIADVGTKTSAFSKILQTVAVLLAGVRDGFRVITAAVLYLGGSLVKFLLAPLEGFIRILGKAAGLMDDDLGAKVEGWADSLNKFRNLGQQAARDIIKPVADGTGAVATAIKQIGDLQNAAARAAKEQKAAGGSAAAGGAITGSKTAGQDAAKFRLPEIKKAAEDSFRLIADGLQRESAAYDQALEDRRISIAEWYAEKSLLAEQDFDNSRAQLQRERDAQAAHLAELAALASRTTDSDDRAKTEKEIQQTKESVAKIDADLIILERDRASQLAKLAGDAAAKEREYQRAIGDTRTALLRAQGQELEARLSEIKRAYDEARNQFANDPNALDIVDKLFNTERARAKFDDLQRQFDEIIARSRARADELNNLVQVGGLSGDTAQAQSSADRQRTVAELQSVTAAMNDLAVATNNPAIVQGAQAAGLALQSMAIESATGWEAAAITLRSSLQNMSDDLAGFVTNTAVQSFAGMFEDLVSGSKSAKDAMLDMVRGFAASLARMAAQALATWAILQVIPEPYRSAIGGLLKVTASVNHGGGIVGASGGRRQVSPLIFAAAPRYHEGGIAGLQPNEVPAILQKGEEVLAKNDPRNVQNGGAAAAGGGGTRIINVIDPSLVSDYLTTSAGEKTILNILQRNSGAVRQTLA